MEWDPTEFQNAIEGLQDRRGGIPRSQIAREAGITQQTLNRWMQPPDAVNKVTQPTPKQLALLAQVPGAPAYNELLRMCGHMPETSQAGVKRPQPIEALANYLASAWPHVEDDDQRAAGMDTINDAVAAIVENVWRVHPSRRAIGRRRPRSTQAQPDSDSLYTLLQTPALA